MLGAMIFVMGKINSSNEIPVMPDFVVVNISYTSHQELM